jgi:hypothetical protein
VSVSVNYEFDQREHYRAMRALTQLTVLRWLPRVVGVFFGVLFLLIILGGIASGHVGGTLINLLPWVLIAGLWTFLIPLSQKWTARRLARTDPSVIGPQQRILDERGFKSIGNGIELQIPWDRFSKVRETEEFFLFFYNWQCAYYVPKRALGSAHRWEAVQLIQRHVGERATLLQSSLATTAG